MYPSEDMWTKGGDGIPSGCYLHALAPADRCQVLKRKNIFQRVTNRNDRNCTGSLF